MILMKYFFSESNFGLKIGKHDADEYEYQRLNRGSGKNYQEKGLRWWVLLILATILNLGSSRYFMLMP